MCREIRRVQIDWVHPKNDEGDYIPLQDGSTFFKEAQEWHGRQPRDENYMPTWQENELTHLMMYETCSEGTPISPAFETPEELAAWLSDNKASAFGSMTATYEQWLDTCRAGWAPSAVCSSGVLRSGVEAMASEK